MKDANKRRDKKMKATPNIGDRVIIARVKFPNANNKIGEMGIVEKVLKTRPMAKVRLDDGSLWEAFIENIELAN